jgi:hypothetical protein
LKNKLVKDNSSIVRKFIKIMIGFFSFWGAHYVCIATSKDQAIIKYAGFKSLHTSDFLLKGFGSAFAINKQGYLITSNHVVDSGNLIRVVFKNIGAFDAQIIKAEPRLDLCILKIPAQTPDYLSITGRTSTLGDDVYTIGYPDINNLGFSQKYTNGVISSLTGLRNDSYQYQISVPIQPGNSGGPLVCEETGEVTGIIDSSLNPDILDYNPQNINYALKSALIRPILDAVEVKSPPQEISNLSSKEIRRRVINSTCLVVACSVIPKEIDHSPPVITLFGNNPMVIEVGSKFVDPGAVSDGNERITKSGFVNSHALGSYTINYTASDLAGNIGKTSRIVTVVDSTPPAINLIGDNPITLNYGDAFLDPGAETENGKKVSVSGSVDTNKPGTYILLYSSIDESGNKTEKRRVVYVTAPSTKLKVTFPSSFWSGWASAVTSAFLGSVQYSLSSENKHIAFINPKAGSSTFDWPELGRQNIYVYLIQKSLLGLVTEKKLIYRTNVDIRPGMNEIVVKYHNR